MKGSESIPKPEASIPEVLKAGFEFFGQGKGTAEAAKEAYKSARDVLEPKESTQQAKQDTVVLQESSPSLTEGKSGAYQTTSR